MIWRAWGHDKRRRDLAEERRKVNADINEAMKV